MLFTLLCTSWFLSHRVVVHTLRVMTLHVLYRTHAGENRKPRPQGYSKATCLRSLLASLDNMRSEFTFTVISDGPVPPELLPLLRPEFHTRVISAGRASVSMRKTLTTARRMARAASDDDVFWLCEDDYLYDLESMTEFCSISRRLDGGAYLTLFVPRATDWHDTHTSQPAVVVKAEAEVADTGTQWLRVGSTTCTYGVRRRALLQDAWLLSACTRAGSPFDAATWSCLQGLQPYPWRYIFRDTDGYLTRRGVLKVIAKPVMRGVVNLIAVARSSRRRRLFAPQRDLAVHAEAYEVPDLNQWSGSNGRVEAA